MPSTYRLQPVVVQWAATGKLYSTGEVLESDPPRRRVYTWPEHQPAPGDLPELVQWEIVPQGASVVVLTLTQERLSDESHEGASSGWPMIISSIKTLLETGRELPIDGRPKVNLEF